MKSGHAETVRVVYDSSRISLTELTEYYFMTIDPLAYHRQGADKGIQFIGIRPRKNLTVGQGMAVRVIVMDLCHCDWLNTHLRVFPMSVPFLLQTGL